jgi:hypothetical protein
MTAAERLKAMLPQVEYKSNGKTQLPVDINPLTNANPQPITMTTTPGEDQTYKLGLYNANKPEVVATDKGLVRVNPRGGGAQYVTEGAVPGAPSGVTPPMPANGTATQRPVTSTFAPSNVVGQAAPGVNTPSVPGQVVGGKNYYGNKVAENAAAYDQELNNRVQTGQDLMMRIDEAQKALAQFKPGMGAEARLTIARAAQAAGMPDTIVQGINNGSVSATQEFQKLSAQQAMESLKQALAGSGRITQAEFKVFQQNNPNIELSADAIHKIYDFTKRVYGRDYQEQQQRQDFLSKGGDPAQWQAKWAQTLDPTGKGTLSIPGQSTPSKIVPKAGTVEGGYLFRGGDPSDPKNWSKTK